MGRPARWDFWLQAVEVIWRGNERPYCCLVSKWLVSGWKLAGMSRANCLVPCGLGGSCLYCESWCWYGACGGVRGAECWCWCQFHGLLLLRHDMTVQCRNDLCGAWARIGSVWKHSQRIPTTVRKHSQHVPITTTVRRLQEIMIGTADDGLTRCVSKVSLLKFAHCQVATRFFWWQP